MRRFEFQQSKNKLRKVKRPMEALGSFVSLDEHLETEKVEVNKTQCSRQLGAANDYTSPPCGTLPPCLNTF